MIIFEPVRIGDIIKNDAGLGLGVAAGVNSRIVGCIELNCRKKLSLKRRNCCIHLRFDICNR